MVAPDHPSSRVGSRLLGSNRTSSVQTVVVWGRQAKQRDWDGCVVCGSGRDVIPTRHTGREQDGKGPLRAFFPPPFLVQVAPPSPFPTPPEPQFVSRETSGSVVSGTAGVEEEGLTRDRGRRGLLSAVPEPAGPNRRPALGCRSRRAPGTEMEHLQRHPRRRLRDLVELQEDAQGRPV